MEKRSSGYMKKQSAIPFPYSRFQIPYSFFFSFSLFFLPPMLPKSIPAYVPSQSLNPFIQPVTPTLGLQPRNPCYASLNSMLTCGNCLSSTPESVLSIILCIWALHFVSYLTHPRPVATAIKTTAVVPGWATPEVTAPPLGATLTASIDLTTIPIVWWAWLTFEHLSSIPGIQGKLGFWWDRVRLFTIGAWWTRTLLSFENVPGFYHG